MSADQYTVETITAIRGWTPKLFSLRLTRSPGFRFTAGQFARLGVEKDGRTVWRAYSMVSSSFDDHLEFFSIVVPGGEFTSELARLSVGDRVHVGKAAFGYLTLDRFQGGRDLWLLATGTGVAPFLSILAEPDVWQRFENVILVYSVREAAELVYRDEIAALARHPLFGEDAARKLRFVPVVTRETVDGTLGQRITALIEQGTLEREAGLAFDPVHSRVMICGNPEMVADTRRILQGCGLALSRLSAPAQLAVEQFW